MRKKIIVMSIACSCILYAGWVDDVKAKADNVYEKSTTSIKESVAEVKTKYENHTKEKAIEEQHELDVCVGKFQEQIPAYGLFLEKHYMNVNSRGERKILNSYKKLRNDGVSADLVKNIDPVLIKKLKNSKSLLEFSSSIISALKVVEKELKKNDKSKLDELTKQVQFLMFAWTTPMEIMSTDNLYNDSLLGLSEDLYQSSTKRNYENYSKFIYSLLYVNLINENVIIKKDTALTGGLKVLFLGGLGILGATSNDTKGIENICKDLIDGHTLKKEPETIVLNNFSKMLNIDKEKLEEEIKKIIKKNNLYTRPKMFSQKIKDLNEVNLVDNPLSDNWYIMVREYMALQDDFYAMKKEISNVIKILNIIPDAENKMATIKQNLFEVDALYRKYDEVVRYNIIDLPISIYADLFYLEFRKGKKWYNDDENAMSNIAVAYNKSCANMQKYMVSEYTINKVIRTQKTFKSEFDEETEWKEIITRAKLTQDWFNMLNKVEIKNK